MWRTCINQVHINDVFKIRSSIINRSFKYRLGLESKINSNITRSIVSNKLDDSYIYYGPLSPQIKAVKFFSLGSSVAGLLAQPIILGQAEEIGSTPLLVAICSVVGFFTFITPVLLHFITKKYVIYMYYNPEDSTYTATTFDFFLRRNEVTFKPEDVEVPDVPGMFSTFNVKGKPLFVEARHFSDPTHYVKIMGYDKPIDFKLGDQNETKK